MQRSSLRDTIPARCVAACAVALLTLGFLAWTPPTAYAREIAEDPRIPSVSPDLKPSAGEQSTGRQGASPVSRVDQEKRQATRRAAVATPAASAGSGRSAAPATATPVGQSPAARTTATPVGQAPTARTTASPVGQPPAVQATPSPTVHSPAVQATLSPTGEPPAVQTMPSPTGGLPPVQAAPDPVFRSFAVMAPAVGSGPSTETEATTPADSSPAEQVLAAPVIPIPAQNPSAGPRPRVGIQAGHWKSNELPVELASLRTSIGATGKGWREADLNLDIARRVVDLLEKEGVQVDLIPATVPSRYKADAFVSLHGDANGNTRLSGYKAARARSSAIPEKDDALVKALGVEYEAGTGLPEHPGTITENMRQYYAFNKRLVHSVDPSTPSAILEMGFLTTAADLGLLQEQPDRIARAVARGVLRFLGR